MPMQPLYAGCDRNASAHCIVPASPCLPWPGFSLDRPSPIATTLDPLLFSLLSQTKPLARCSISSNTIHAISPFFSIYFFLLRFLSYALSHVVSLILSPSFTAFRCLSHCALFHFALPPISDTHQSLLLPRQHVCRVAPGREGEQQPCQVHRQVRV